MTPAKIVNDNGADFRSVISNIADSVIIVDQEGNICFANPSAEALFGRSLEDLLGRPFGFPGIREQSTEIEVVSKGGESHTAEMRMTETVWEGKKVYLASIRDISELKRMEQRLRKQGHYLAERVKELNCLYSISKLIERQKISLEEIFQGTVELMHHAWQYPEITCARIILNGQEFATENFKETSWKQFSDIFVSGKKAGVLEVNYLEERPEDKEGPFSKGERGLIDAIVERLGHAIEKITAEEALRESENFLRSIIENIPDMIFVKNAKELRFVRFNKAGEELLGYSREKLIGKNDYDFFPKEEAAFFIEKDRDVLSSGKPLDIPEESILKTLNCALLISISTNFSPSKSK
jgi:PAS domain-containing protein